MKANPLLDNDFLEGLFSQKLLEKFVKLIILDINELPIEEIQGRATGGSINIDGSSAVRRTCSITLAANELNIHEYYWGLHEKFKVYVGLRNYIDEDYEDIIWFPQGMFLITTFNTTQSTNSWQISIQGKDKMSLLNGDISGNVMSASWDFGAVNFLDEDGTKTKKKYLLKDIIREGVHKYAKEPYHNIIVNDLDDETTLALEEYLGKRNIYLFYPENNDETIASFTNDSSTIVYMDTAMSNSITLRDLFNMSDFNPYIRIENDISLEPTTIYAYPSGISSIIDDDYDEAEYEEELTKLQKTNAEFVSQLKENLTEDVQDALNDLDEIASVYGTSSDKYFSAIEKYRELFKVETEETETTEEENTSETEDEETGIEEEEEEDTEEEEEELQEYKICKIEQGQTIGYVLTDFVYNGDLIASNGEAFTSGVLDKIVSMLNSQLGGYEYFYNLDGQFVFQKKKDYISTSWNNITDNDLGEEYEENSESVSSIGWFFENTTLITSIQNTPNFANLKNDYSVWGVKGDNTAIHIRYALDDKPVYYKTYDGVVYTTEKYDWRELIYQMAYDEVHYNTMGNENSVNYDPNFHSVIRENNQDYYPTGYTGYEQYYEDIYGFWRELYDPALVDYAVTYVEEEEYNNGIYYWYEKCKEDDSYIVNGNYYYFNSSTVELVKIEVAEANYNYESLYLLCSNKDSTNAYVPDDVSYSSTRSYYVAVDGTYYKEGSYKYWSKQVFTDPESLIFWFDFLDTDENSDLSKFNVRKIGDRTKTENEEKYKSLYYLTTPLAVFCTEIPENASGGYTYITVDQDFLDTKLTLEKRNISLKNRLDNLLYNYTYCADTINITTLPIYHLQPNTRIYAYDEKSGINGEYIIKTISIPLTYNGTSVISAYKAAQKIS